MDTLIDWRYRARNGLLPGGLAVVLSAAALVISVIALISLPGTPDEFDGDYEFHLSDRGEFTVDLVQQALRRYDEEGREATVRYYNSPESAVGEWYVFIYDENDQAIAHLRQDLLGQDLKDDLGVDAAGYRFGEVMVGAGEQGLWVDYLFLNPNTGNRSSNIPGSSGTTDCFSAPAGTRSCPVRPWTSPRPTLRSTRWLWWNGPSATTRPTAERERCSITILLKAWTGTRACSH